MSKTNLEYALTDVLDEEIIAYGEMGSQDHHVFSRRYKKRKQKILQEATYGGREFAYTNSYRTGHMSHRRRSAILAAVLIMILAITAVAIAIIKPHIYYVIKEKVISWDISFEQEKDETGSKIDAVQFAYMKPKTPNGYSIVSEDKESDRYSVEYKDDDGHSIYYSQYLPDDVTTSIDSERHKITKEKIGEYEVMIGVSDKDVLSICNDGNYVYDIDGTCDSDTIKKMMESILLKKNH